MNEKSKELQSKLQTIKEGIESENSVYIDMCREAQQMLDFDLSDSRMLQKMSSAIKKVNDANTTYYAYLIAKLKEVDQLAKAYDIAELDYQVVEQVYQLIQYINEESNIENSFEGSLNFGFSSTNMGTMAVVSYNPSIEAKELEFSWKNLLDKLPSSKKQEYYEQKNEEENEKIKYRKAYNAWEKACKPFAEQREEYVNNVISEKSKELQKELLSKYTSEKKDKEKQIQSIRNSIINKSAELKQLGLFKRKEKQIIQSEIQGYQNQIDDLNQLLSQLKLKFDEDQLVIGKIARDSVEKTAKLEAEKIYPFPVEPDKPEIIKREEQAEEERINKLLFEIIEVLNKEDTLMTRDDLNRYFMGQKNRLDMMKALERGVKDQLIWHDKCRKKDVYAPMH